jgi:excisionase family DNA binding protein
MSATPGWGSAMIRSSEQTRVIETLLTYQDAANRLGVTSRTIWQLVKDQKLKTVRFGRSVRIDPVDLRAFIEKGKSQPPNRRKGGASDAE